MNIVLSVEKLTTQFRIQNRLITIVDALSFNLKRGQTLALIGESGSGKTVVAESIMQIIPKPPLHRIEGAVDYRGVNLLKQAPSYMQKVRGAKIAMIFQDPQSALNPLFTLEDQFLQVLYSHQKLTAQEAKKRIEKCFVEVGIEDPTIYLQRYPHEISGGMQQRVMIAMALILQPDVLIADEPTVSLDLLLQRQVIDLMKTLQKKMGLAILLITHDKGVIAEMADEVMVMYRSEALEHMDIKTFFDRPWHPYTQSLQNCASNLYDSSLAVTTLKSSIKKGCVFAHSCPYIMPACREKKVPIYLGRKEHHWVRCLLFKSSKKKMR